MPIVTADVFSGRPNPRWFVTTDVAEEVLRIAPGALDSASPWVNAPDILGFRGIVVEPEPDHRLHDDAPRGIRLAGGGRGSEQMGAAELLIRAMLSHPEATAALNPVFPVTEELLEGLLARLDELANVDRTIDEGARRGPGPEPGAAEAGTSRSQEVPLMEASIEADCRIEWRIYEPEPWNDCGPIMESNNCYNYARNHRTDTFAQPGRGSGQMVVPVYTVDNVARAAVRDGARWHGDCLPETENPRWFVALAVCPNPAYPYNDYHWYRLNGPPECWRWSHKPGRDYPTNRDNGKNFISDPYTADRGRYTAWGGYFYAPRSMAIR